MDLVKYLKENNAQKQIDKLAKKLKNKRVVVYGGGEYFETIVNNYDLSKLNIIAVADLKFSSNKSANKTPYTPIAPDDLKEYDMDVIVMALINDLNVLPIVENKVLKGSKNEDIEIRPIITPTLSYIIRLFFNKI